MSVRCISKVLDDSVHTGTDLLMLIILADYSDDDGNSYPAVASLARKCRTTPRHANRILVALRDSGELEVRQNEGPRGTNRYRIVLRALGASKAANASGPLTHASPLTPVSAPTHASPLTGASSLTPTSGTPDAHVLKPLTPMSDEPSMNRHEPSVKAKLPPCPYSEIVNRYHEALPELPRVKLLDKGSKREKAVKAFWEWVLKSEKTDGSRRAETGEQALTWIAAYFERAAQNDFLMGKTARSEAHSGWKCTIDFLMSEKGLLQVIERTGAAA